VSLVPSIDGIGLRLQGATSDQGIIDRSADDAGLSGLLDDGVVLVASECDKRKALPNALQEEQYLLATLNGVVRAAGSLSSKPWPGCELRSNPASCRHRQRLSGSSHDVHDPQ
jgi:hypothetical protein